MSHGQVSLEIFLDVWHAAGMKKILQEYMDKEKLTQVEMAERIGVHQGVLNHWLHGRRSPNLKSLARISKRTGIRIERLVEGM